MGEFIIKQIDMTLDPSSIQRAIDQINELKGLEPAMNKLCEAVLQEGRKVAMMNLIKYGMSARNLRKSLRVEMNSGKANTGYLEAGYPGDHGSELAEYANVSYAVFIEYGFGTSSNYLSGHRLIKSQRYLNYYKQYGGIEETTGRTKTHPSGRNGPKDLEEYSTMKLPNKGEFFGWVYKSRKDGKFYISRGQEPKPFMYDTLQELADYAERHGGELIAQYIP